MLVIAVFGDKPNVRMCRLQETALSGKRDVVAGQICQGDSAYNSHNADLFNSVNIGDISAAAA